MRVEKTQERSNKIYFGRKITTLPGPIKIATLTRETKKSAYLQRATNFLARFFNNLLNFKSPDYVLKTGEVISKKNKLIDAQFIGFSRK